MCWPWERKKRAEKFLKLKEDTKLKTCSEDCAVCLAGILVVEAIVCSNCSKIMHIKCLKRWENACKKNNVPFSCPLCRIELEGIKSD